MLNKAQLIGFTGSEAEIRTTHGGKKVAMLRVAITRYSKKSGERQDYTTWHTVEIWSAATVKWLEGNGLPTGTKVYVEGEIRNDRYTDNAGVERYVSKVVIATAAREVKALERPGECETSGQD
jgi:single-strand DNA-binding protein